MSLPRSYPPETHHADVGEARAWMRRDDEPVDITNATRGTQDYFETLARGELPSMTEEQCSELMVRHDTYRA